MKFLKLSDIKFAFSLDLLEQITCDNNDTMLNMAEDRALTMVKEWLSPLYDIDYELRPYSVFTPNVEYDDNQRVLIDTNNTGLTESIKAFSEERGIVLINSGLTQETIYIKTPNACPTEKTTFYEPKMAYNSINKALQSTYSQQFNSQNLSFENDNPNYSADCGQIVYSSSTAVTATTYVYTTDTVFNYYNTKFVPISGATKGYDSTACTYNQIYSAETLNFTDEFINSGNTPGFYVDNIDYFEQYRQSNLTRDFSIDDRNSTLIRIVSDITLFEIFQRTSPNGLNETRQMRYEQAMKDLKAARKGEIQIDLKVKDENRQGQKGSRIRWTDNWGTNYLNNF